MTQLIFVRHGQSIANSLEKFAGHSDFDLTELGHRQARITAEYIKENFKVDVIYASDLKRAYNTAVPVAELFSLPIIPDKQLREIYAGSWEGLHKDDIFKNFKEDFDTWNTDIASSRCTCGESVAELYERVCTRVLQIARENDGKTVLIATHATPIRVFETMARGYDATHVGEISFVANASVSVFKYEDGRFFPVSSNIKEHMKDLVTEVPKYFGNNTTKENK